MKKVYVKIKPTDTSFFRDSFTFKKGLNNYLQSLDIPYPSVFYGAILSAFLRQGRFENVKNKIKEINEDKKNTKLNNELNEELKKSFKIDDIYIYDEYRKEVFVSAPLDIFYNDFQKRLGKYDGGFFYNPEKSELGKFERSDGMFVGLNDLIDYYSENKLEHVKLYPNNYFFTKYKKTGIGIDRNTGRAKDGMMYRIDMTEFCDRRFSYLLRCEINENEQSIEKDVIKLGGESKLAEMACTFSNIRFLEDIYKDKDCSSEKIKIILTSPMIINKKYEDFKLENHIISAVTGKPNFIGGFNMASGNQKKIMRAIPQGSILVVENKEFKGKKIADIKIDFINDSDQRFKGFGSYIILPFVEG